MTDFQRRGLAAQSARDRILGNNLSWLRRFATTRLKHHPLKESLRGKMQIASWNDDFLAEVLTGQQL